MRKLSAIITLLFCAVLMNGCLKSEKGCETQSPSAEEPQLVNYASANGITATKHSSGIYYEIISAGSGTAPNLSSRVFVTYTGKLTDGTVFEKVDTPVNFILGGLIEGWKIGIPLIKKGGRIKLIIPSSLAYSCPGQPSAGIPSNAVLFFDITLVDVQ
jgi:FKBP-type peptidyl-prolyl cis-trans isomerase FkpA